MNDGPEEFEIDVFSFFKHRTGLWEEYEEVQSLLEVEEHKILRFVSMRWLSMLPVVKRLLEQWEALSHFLKNLKTNHPKVAKQERVKRILYHLEGQDAYIKMLSLKSALPLLGGFEKKLSSNRNNGPNFA